MQPSLGLVRDQPGGMSDADFARLTDPYRHELLALCYRMLGSNDEAEDIVQETYLSAWRAWGAFEGRSSPRTWLYRIATHACLRALEHGRRRALPSGLGAPGEDSGAPVPRREELAWLRPLPDHLVGRPADPADTVASRQSLRLAFVAALQYLPPRQRAVLILRDVLSWRSAEVAELIGSSQAAVNSALQRARVQLRQVGPTEDTVDEPRTPEQRRLLDSYVTAFQAADVDTLTRLLARDAVWEMPPIALWFRGRRTVVRFLADRVLAAGAIRMLPAALNGQPGFGVYVRGPDGIFRPHGVQVLSIVEDLIRQVVTFHDPALATACGLPETLI
jgi:RNA polymerase sigma-70 factor, ECF subfamily